MTKEYNIKTDSKSLQTKLEMAQIFVAFKKLGFKEIPTAILKECSTYNPAKIHKYSNAWHLKSVTKDMLKIYKEALSKVELC